MSQIPQERFSPQGQRLQALAKTGSVNDFKGAFIIAVRHWADELNFCQPNQLNLHTSKYLVGQNGGATPAQVKLLYNRIRIELNCPLVHPSASHDTLDTMATFYYQHMYRQLAK